MMKTINKMAPWVLGLGLVVSSGTVRAQMGQLGAGNSSRRPAFISHPAALAPKLREIILRVQPQAKFEFGANTWRASYRSPNATTHLVDERGNTLKEAGEFPADFAEFALELAQDTDIMYYRAGGDVRSQAESFGTTITTRANLERYFPVITRAVMQRYGNGDSDVPLGHWAYEELVKLSRSGMFKDWKPQKLEEIPVLLRREFAWIAKHMRNQIQQEPHKLAHSEDLMTALSDLESEFAPEIADWDENREPLAQKTSVLKTQVRGMPRQTRYRFLSLRFSYGKGVPAALVEEIRQAIEEYAAQSMKESEAAIKMGTVPQWK